ncbi:MAG: helix-hairpin-helix domain-containing protein [Microthrixaceae bacterium]
MQTGSTRRASDVLEALVREPTRRSLYKRSRAQETSIYGPPEQAGFQRNKSSSSSEESELQERDLAERNILGLGKPPYGMNLQVKERLNQFGGRKVLAGLGVIAVVAVGIGLTSVGRPASVEDRLPIASNATMGQTGSSAVSPASSPASTAAAGTASAANGSGIAGPVFVHVAGAVLSAGVVQLPAGSRVVDAVAAAGGLRPEADSNRVNLAATLLDGSQVMIPSVGQPDPTQVSVVQGSVPGGSVSGGSMPGTVQSPSVAGPINLNTATIEQLDSLPGVGPATAQAILSFREKAGKFDSVEALLDVRGIGDAKFEALRELVTI